MTQQRVDVRGVVRVRNDNTEIYGIWLQDQFVWPDPWTDIWDEGTNVFWENVWRDQWSVAMPEGPILKETVDGNQ